jgi:hypothetical protein
MCIGLGITTIAFGYLTIIVTIIAITSEMNDAARTCRAWPAFHSGSRELFAQAPRRLPIMQSKLTLALAEDLADPLAPRHMWCWSGTFLTAGEQ